ncbi:hypothetical protein Syun_028743 [Stephania yunnanensis]|uniref:Uncharacterized protein n=1 Tax=Stephania yunnanensis TaxID=152371 RepID=A0AAP0ECD9_9MAGN
MGSISVDCIVVEPSIATSNVTCNNALSQLLNSPTCHAHVPSSLLLPTQTLPPNHTINTNSTLLTMTSSPPSDHDHHQITTSQWAHHPLQLDSHLHFTSLLHTTTNNHNHLLSICGFGSLLSGDFELER